MANGIDGLKTATTVTGQLITISSALLAFTVTFAEKFSPKGGVISPPLSLKISWLCFALSILLGFWTLNAITGTITEIDRGKPETNPQRYNIRIPAGIMFLVFLLGVTFLIASGWVISPP